MDIRSFFGKNSTTSSQNGNTVKSPKKKTDLAIKNDAKDIITISSTPPSDHDHVPTKAVDPAPISHASPKQARKRGSSRILVDSDEDIDTHATTSVPPTHISPRKKTKSDASSEVIDNTSTPHTPSRPVSTRATSRTPTPKKSPSSAKKPSLRKKGEVKKEKDEDDEEDDEKDESWQDNPLDEEDDDDEDDAFIDDEDSDEDTGKARKQRKGTKKQPQKPRRTPTPKAETLKQEPPSSTSESSSLPTAKSPATNNYWQRAALMHHTGPKAPGTKPLPTGQENCLEGLTFVFTGEMTSTTRDDGQDLVKRHGGRVTQAVSKKTDYLVIGDDAGPSKLSRAKELHIPTLTEDQLFDLILTRPSVASAITMTGMKEEEKGVKEEKGMKEEKKEERMIHEKPLLSSSHPTETQLWTDKYRPQSIKDLIGNKANVERLQSWLQTWRPATKGSGAFNAALISGPPGIGKTTAVHLVARELSMDVLEYNASDTRSKKSLSAQLQDKVRNRTIASYFGRADASTKPSQVTSLIVMDEVDGMSAGDRGGMAELIQLIRRTQVPIVCLCNDRSSPKVRSLANYCLDLRFRRPDANQCRSRLMTIAFREKLTLKPNVIDELVASTQADIRQMLTLLSTWKLRTSSETVTYDEAKAIHRKDFDAGPFDIIKKFLNGTDYDHCTMSDLVNAYFQDYSLMPLMVQENYLSTEPALLRNHPKAQMALVSRAAEAISLGDLLEQRIRREQDWSLLPVHAVYSCVMPGHAMRGFFKGKLEFPSWLGNFSKEGKGYRLLRELQTHVRLRVSADKRDLRDHYLPVMRSTLVRPLSVHGVEAVKETAERMAYYYLTREDWDTLNELALTDKAWVQNIAASTKAALTRTYTAMAVAMPYAMNAGGKGGVKMAAEGLDFDMTTEKEEVEEEEVEGEEEGNEEKEGEGEDLKADKMIKQKAVKSGGKKK